ncbi:hypothetical protein [Nocardia farcinica]|uniref:hypothetical protein n=1 Tax=Nocardia farcinica TaxID=37329 RepID=UPI0015F0736B|nr:hypothetical protein [Nocardia farcinica]MBA4854293.1 hypothetical protein [Nocardia farcinica]MBC9814478.1 hypothetical protein [Nocardia farcinica]
MTVHETAWTMTSDVTPEWACRETGDGPRRWRLSWLPDRLLTREQARAGMELDELLSDPAAVGDRFAHARMAERADRLGILWEHALILISKRILTRLRTREGEPVPQPPGCPGPATPETEEPETPLDWLEAEPA